MNKVPLLIHICINFLIKQDPTHLINNKLITNVNISRIKKIIELCDKCLNNCGIATIGLVGLDKNILLKVILHSSDAFLEKINENNFALNYEDILDAIKYDFNLCRSFFSTFCFRYQYADFYINKEKYQTLQLQQSLLEFDGIKLCLIRVQTQELCDIAFNNNKCCIEFMKTEFKTNQMCLRAVREDGFLLNFMEDLQSIEICLAAVTQSGLAIQFVKTKFRTPQVCLLAAKQNFESLKFISDFQTIEIRDLYWNNYSSYCIKHINRELLTDEFCLKAIKLRAQNIRHIPIEKQTKEICEIAVRADQDCFPFINKKFQTIALCVRSIQNINNYNFIKVKSAQLCLELFRMNYDVFRYIEGEFQTEELCLAAVQYDAEWLEFVKIQTLLICLEAVTNNPNCFRFVNEQFQSEKICLIAVKFDWNFLKIIKNQTTKICKAAIRESFMAYHCIRDEFITLELCLFTVKKKPTCLASVKYQSIEICTVAVKKDFSVFVYVKKEYQSVELCLIAVNGLGSNLGLVYDQTLEICSAAIANDPDAKKFVRSKFKKFFCKKRKHSK
jgi:hypothetical protein